MIYYASKLKISNFFKKLERKIYAELIIGNQINMITLQKPTLSCQDLCITSLCAVDITFILVSNNLCIPCVFKLRFRHK